jgi:hypothetical protein
VTNAVRVREIGAGELIPLFSLPGVNVSGISVRQNYEEYRQLTAGRLAIASGDLQGLSSFSNLNLEVKSYG